MSVPAPSQPEQPELKRAIGLPLLILYGLGVTVGAGIYVLVGVAAGRAGIYAPISFVLAAIVMLFSAASYAEMSSRFPVSAGEATYVREGLGWPPAALIVGILVMIGASVAGATISLGAVGYLQAFIGLPTPVLVVGVIVLMGIVAGLGTLESIGFAAVMTVIEISALIAIIAGGFFGPDTVLAQLPDILTPGWSAEVWTGIAGAGLLSFFAFIGFEDMVNVAEETRDPERSMPIAIFITLGTVTLIYFLVSAVAVLSVPMEALSSSDAPLGLVFAAVTGMPSWMVTLIAIVATLNGVIIQIIMASRVLYGLAEQGSIPSFLGRINPVTRTPLIATAVITGAVLLVASSSQLEYLAQFTSQVTLIILLLVNLALIGFKRRGGETKAAGFTVPLWVPVTGTILSLALLGSGFFA